jgi:outer membrane protein assembly factor BamB
MTVVNCEEWVSLRARPDTSSARLAQVPLNAVVSDCSAAGEFVYCRYGRQYGYILAEYLMPYFMDAAPEYIDLLSGGECILNRTMGGYTLLAYREYGSFGERVKLGCFDAAGRTVWTTQSVTAYVTELTMTDAFVAGTPEYPLVMVYNAEYGLSALNFYTGELRWKVAPEKADLGASISWAVDEGGTIYIGGYYGPDPVAIDLTGNVLWKSNAGDDFFWLYEIELGERGIIAHYDHAGDGEASGAVLYDASGYVIGTRIEK